MTETKKEQRCCTCLRPIPPPDYQRCPSCHERFESVMEYPFIQIGKVLPIRKEYYIGPGDFYCLDAEENNKLKEYFKNPDHLFYRDVTDHVIFMSPESNGCGCYGLDETEVVYKILDQYQDVVKQLLKQDGQTISRQEFESIFQAHHGFEELDYKIESYPAQSSIRYLITVNHLHAKPYETGQRGVHSLLELDLVGVLNRSPTKKKSIMDVS